MRLFPFRFLVILMGPIFSTLWATPEAKDQPFYSSLVSAEASMAKLNFREAIQTYNKLIGANTNSAWLHFCRGQAKAKSGDWNGALADYELALKKVSLSKGPDTLFYGNAVQIRYHRAVALDNLGRGKEAMNAYMDVCRETGGIAMKSEGFQGYYVSLAYPKMISYLEKDPPEILKTSLPQVLADTNLTDPIRAKKIFDIGNELHRKYGLFQSALDCMEKSITLDPAKSAYHKEKAFVLDKMRRTGDAIQSYRKAIELDPANYMAGNNLSYVYKRSGGHHLRINENIRTVETFLKKSGAREAFENVKSGKMPPDQLPKISLPAPVQWQMEELLDVYPNQWEIEALCTLVETMRLFNWTTKEYPKDRLEVLWNKYAPFLPAYASLEPMRNFKNTGYYQNLGESIDWSLALSKPGKKIPPKPNAGFFDKWEVPPILQDGTISFVFRPDASTSLPTRCARSNLFQTISKLIWDIPRGTTQTALQDSDIEKIVQKDLSLDLNVLLAQIRNEIVMLDEATDDDPKILFKLARHTLLYAMDIWPGDVDLAAPYFQKSWALFTVLNSFARESKYLEVYRNTCLMYLAAFSQISYKINPGEKSVWPPEIQLMDLATRNRVSLLRQFPGTGPHRYLQNLLRVHQDQVQNQPWGDPSVKDDMIIQGSYFNYSENGNLANNLPFKAFVCRTSVVGQIASQLNQEGATLLINENANIRSILDLTGQTKALKLLDSSPVLQKKIKEFDDLKSFFHRLETLPKEEREKALAEWLNLGNGQFLQNYGPLLKEILQFYRHAPLTEEPWYFRGFSASDYLTLSHRMIVDYQLGCFNTWFDRYWYRNGMDDCLKRFDGCQEPALESCRYEYNARYSNEDFPLERRIAFATNVSRQSIHAILALDKRLPSTGLRPFFTNDSFVQILERLVFTTGYIDPFVENIILFHTYFTNHQISGTLLRNAYRENPYLGSDTIWHTIRYFPGPVAKDPVFATKETYLRDLVSKQPETHFPLKLLGRYYLLEMMDPEKALNTLFKGLESPDADDGILMDCVASGRMTGREEILQDIASKIEIGGPRLYTGHGYYELCKSLGWFYVDEGNLTQALAFHNKAASEYSYVSLKAQGETSLLDNKLSPYYRFFFEHALGNDYRPGKDFLKGVLFLLDLGDQESIGLIKQKYPKILDPETAKQTAKYFQIFGQSYP